MGLFHRSIAAVAALLAVTVGAGAMEGAASAPMSRPAGSFDVATFWYLNAPNCPAGEVITPGGCVCEAGLSRVDGLCILPPPPTPPTPVVETPKPPEKAIQPKKMTPRRTVPVKAAPNQSVPLRPSEGIAGFQGAGRPCLDADLYDLIASSYGRRPTLAACVAGCVPRPAASLTSAADLDRLAKANGVAWCPESCIRVTGWMPADEVLRLEALTGRTFCPVDGQNYCRAPDMAGVPVTTTVQKVLAFYTAPAPTPPQPSGTVALILGFGAYKGALPADDHAARDAAAVKALMEQKLGYAPDSIVAVDDLTKADLLKLIGPDGALAAKKPTQSLFVYVSGQGLSDAATGTAYLLPVDADPDHLAETAVPLQDIYDALGKLGTPSLTVALEASFPTSVAGLVDPPNLPATDVAVLPQKPVPGLSVFTAADRDQQTLVDPEVGTGLFTRWLLEGLAGAADTDPIGNGDRRIESVELYVFTAHHVRVSARKSFGLEQKPLISESQNALMRSF